MSGTPSTSRRLTTGLLLLAAVAGFLLTYGLYGIDSAWFAQNNHNRRFIEGADFAAALAEYRKTWPPLYPSLLFGWTRIGFSAESMNALLGVLSIGLVARLGWRLAPGVAPFWPALTWALCGAHALIARQLLAEELLVLLTLGGLELALCYRASRALRHLLPLALISAGIGLTRYFGILWLFVPAGLWILACPGPPKRRFAHAALFTVIAAGLVSPWFWHVQSETGYPTGIDRFNRSETGRMAGSLHLITPAANVEATLESLYIDTLSTHAFAKARRGTYAREASEAGLLLGTSACLAAWATFAWRRRRSGRSRADERGGKWVLTALCVWFFALVLVLWSLSNNDPINTRFLFPVYPLLLLAGFELYGRWKTEATPIELLPARILLGLVLVANILRHVGL